MGNPMIRFKNHKIDERLLRPGSANFSASGQKRQDNDLVVINGPEAAETFKRGL